MRENNNYQMDWEQSQCQKPQRMYKVSFYNYLILIANFVSYLHEIIVFYFIKISSKAIINILLINSNIYKVLILY